MYVLTLLAHSYTRWAVLIPVLLVSVRCALGWAQGREWTRADELAHKALIVAVDWQFTLGAIMYLCLSPNSRVFFMHLNVGYGDPTLRFFGLNTRSR